MWGLQDETSRQDSFGMWDLQRVGGLPQHAADQPGHTVFIKTAPQSAAASQQRLKQVLHHEATVAVTAVAAAAAASFFPLPAAL